MFIEFVTSENKRVLLNTQQIVSIESQFRTVAPGLGGGGNEIRIFATEGRVFVLDPRKHNLQAFIEQMRTSDCTPAVAEVPKVTDGQDKNPVGF